MATTTLEVGIRPQRVAVLLPRNGTHDHLTRAIKFLSAIWGGKYCPIVPVEPSTSDERAERLLADARPDFVLGMDVDHDVWRTVTDRIIQPRRYADVSGGIEALENVRLDPELVRARASVRRFRTEAHRQGARPQLRFVEVDWSSDFGPFVAAAFGIPNDDHRLSGQEATWNDPVAPHSFAELLVSWDQICHSYTCIKIGSFGLSPHHLFAPIRPSVVAVANPVEDLALFWNLRFSEWMSGQVIPFPIRYRSSSESIEALAAALMRTGGKRCEVVTWSVPPAQVTELRDALTFALRNSGIEVAVVTPDVRHSLSVAAFDSVKVVDVGLSDNILTWTPPEPTVLDDLSDSDTWIVEAFRDKTTGRALGELHLPPRPCVFEVLNSACPPQATHSVIDDVGDGLVGLTFRCRRSRRDLPNRFFVPTETEILSEILTECGVAPEADDKSRNYQPVIEMFGSLYRASKALSSVPGKLLCHLSRAHGPRTIEQLKGKLKLGSGGIAEAGRPTSWFDFSLHGYTPAQQRTSKSRFNRHWDAAFPVDEAPQSVLSHWASRGVVVPKFELPPCPRCGIRRWRVRLSIARPILCRGCGARLEVPPTFKIGWTLNTLVRQAIEQGIIPVVLAGQFLDGLVSRGFLWVPGIRTTEAEIDIAALCDGNLVLAECKSAVARGPRTPTWDQVCEQFDRLAAVAAKCRADLVVLAVMEESIPQMHTDRIDKSAKRHGLPALVLQKQDLEAGRRMIPDSDEKERRMTIDDAVGTGTQR